MQLLQLSKTNDTPSMCKQNNRGIQKMLVNPNIVWTMRFWNETIYMVPFPQAPGINLARISWQSDNIISLANVGQSLFPCILIFAQDLQTNCHSTTTNHGLKVPRLPLIWLHLLKVYLMEVNMMPLHGLIPWGPVKACSRLLHHGEINAFFIVINTYSRIGICFLSLM